MSEQMTPEAMERRFQRLEPWWTRTACTEPLECEHSSSAKAKAVCAACPVRRECLEDVLAREVGIPARSRDPYVIGGLVASERAAINAHLCQDCHVNARSGGERYCLECSARRVQENKARYREKGRAA